MAALRAALTVVRIRWGELGLARAAPTDAGHNRLQGGDRARRGRCRGSAASCACPARRAGGGNAPDAVTLGAVDEKTDLPGAGGPCIPELAGEVARSAVGVFIASGVGGCFEASPVSARA